MEGGRHMVIAILGAGASGMAAALAAAEQPGCQVHLLERQSRVGRKLLATGNGRCNLTNRNLSLSSYFGEDPQFAAPSLQAFGLHDTLDFFSSLGLMTVTEPSGRVYPRTDQAGSVVDVLRFALNRPNITLHLGWEVTRVKTAEQGFVVYGPENLRCDKVIVAMGGLAGTALGGSMAGYRLLRELGHHCTKLRPSLVQVKSGYPRCPALKGVRAVCGLCITKDGVPVRRDLGEVQFTQYGLSGPAIFAVSRDVCQGPGDWVCHLNLLPEEEDPARLLRARLRPNLPAGELLTGAVHNRLGKVAVQEAGIDLQQPSSDLEDGQLRRLAQIVGDFPFRLTGTMGMDSAQVTAGGICTGEFDPRTLESRLCPGLYACGEVLDIDGACGGYNLQWAWSSGRMAGRNAGR